MESEIPETDSTKNLPREIFGMKIRSNEPEIFSELEFTKMKNVKIGNQFFITIPEN